MGMGKPSGGVEKEVGKLGSLPRKYKNPTSE